MVRSEVLKLMKRSDTVKVKKKKKDIHFYHTFIGGPRFGLKGKECMFPVLSEVPVRFDFNDRPHNRAINMGQLFTYNAKVVLESSI